MRPRDQEPSEWRAIGERRSGKMEETIVSTMFVLFKKLFDVYFPLSRLLISSLTFEGEEKRKSSSML